MEFCYSVLVRVSQPGPTEWLSGSHEQGPLINTSAVILQNPSVTVKLKSIFVDEHRPQVLGVFGRGTQTMKG